jgi:hypothetical protein
MSAIPEPQNSIQALIDAQHETRAEPPRPHMGCSQLGHPCDRWLWLSFRWAVQPKFPGRILRVFRRGQMEENTIISDLRAIGIDVRGTQTRVDFGCHVSGSLDGIAEHGVPEAKKTRHVLEFKTHSLKSFNDLEKQGLAMSKPEHYVQMQLYMHGTKIDRGLYLAVCKDDDRIYTERVQYYKGVAEKAVERGHRLALAERMPPPISTDPSWYQCRFCDAHSFCHDTRLTQHANCRTCAHSTPKPDSTWRCERHQSDGIPSKFQAEGCASHVLHPDLVPWPMGESDTDWVAVYMVGDKPVKNGEGHYASSELIANAEACASGVRDEFAQWGAKIVA